MKKFLIMALFLTLFLTGCVGLPVIYECNCPKEEEKPNPNPNPNPGENVGDIKTGMAIVTNIAKSETGKAEYDVTLVAVTVNAQGVITSCKIDSVGTTVKFENGTISTALNSEIKSKQELGDAYNMVAYGGAKAEWYEQVNALAAYCVGKTAEQVQGIAVDGGTKPTNADLATSVTIAIGGYKNAIVKAVNNATNLGAQAGDTLHIAVNSSIASSANPTADKNGTAQLDLDFTAVTEKNGIITSCIIDSVQAKVSFDSTGAIKTDLTKEVKTKNELGSDYNMVTYGGAIAEWNEQAASFCQYIKGKTAEQVQGIAVDEGTKPTDTDLNTSVTIAIGGFKALITEALA